MPRERNAVQVVLRVKPCPFAGSFSVDQGGKSVTVRHTTTNVDGIAKQELLSFACEAALENASQERMFEAAGKPVADAVLDGYNGTVLCYGQTGAGKSFTIVGSKDQYAQRGLAPRTIAHAFREASNRPEFEYTFKFSCLEIYNDTMYDLLSTLPSDKPRRQELSLAENRGKVEIKGLAAPNVENEQAALQLLFTAEANRATAQHQLNQVSSRSHVLYMLQVERRSRIASGGVTVSLLTLVDLAGSERLKKSSSGSGPAGGTGALGGGAFDKVAGEGGEVSAAKQLAREAMSINKSLSFLEQVVVALSSRKSHVPHRSSKLTAVLRESLGGNCKTTLVANLWQAPAAPRAHTHARTRALARCLRPRHRP